MAHDSALPPFDPNLPHRVTEGQPHSFNPPELPKPPTTYRQVCVTPIMPTSKMVTLAGQTGLRKDGTIAPNISSQAKDAYLSIHAGLKAAGATMRDIIMVRHYIVERTGDALIDTLPIVDLGWGSVYEQFMDFHAEGHRPPDTVVGVASLAKKELLYECEVTALVHERPEVTALVHEKPGVKKDDD